MLKHVLVVGLCLAVVSPAFAATYEVDKVHSTLGFAVKHLVVATTRGQFNAYTGEIEYDPQDFSKFKADVTIDVSSIDTNNPDRDNHLKSPDFFHADKFPAITFNNAVLVRTETGGAAITGDLTIKAVTKRITIPVELSGPVKSPMGGEDVIGIAGETMINRQDFGITFSKIMDNGGLAVDDKVKLVIEIEAHAKK